MLLSIQTMIILNKDVFFKLASDNLHLALYKNKEFRIIPAGLSNKVKEYIEIANIQFKDNNYNVKYGYKYIGSTSIQKKIKPLKKIPKKSSGITITNDNDCYYIKNVKNKCLTKVNKVKKSDDVVYKVSYKKCNSEENQCFHILNTSYLNKLSTGTKLLRDDKDKESSSSSSETKEIFTPEEKDTSSHDDNLQEAESNKVSPSDHSKHPSHHHFNKKDQIYHRRNPFLKISRRTPISYENESDKASKMRENGNETSNDMKENHTSEYINPYYHHDFLHDTESDGFPISDSLEHPGHHHYSRHDQIYHQTNSFNNTKKQIQLSHKNEEIYRTDDYQENDFFDNYPLSSMYAKQASNKYSALMNYYSFSG